MYFAVDYDALGYEIESNILPYFQGIKQTLSTYRIGVYGTRNVCSQVISAGYALTAYVSDMSSGFSGNLGFSIPTGWNFDQFNEITMDDWGIDKVGYSGRYGYVTAYTSYTSENLADLPTDIRNDILINLINDYLSQLNCTPDPRVTITYQPSSYITIYNDGKFSIAWCPSIELAVSEGEPYDSLTLTYDGDLTLSTDSIEALDQMSTGLDQIFSGLTGSLIAGTSNFLEFSQSDSLQIRFLGFDISGFSISVLLENTIYTTQVSGYDYTVKLSQEFRITCSFFSQAFAVRMNDAYIQAVNANQRFSFGLILFENLNMIQGQPLSDEFQGAFTLIDGVILLGVVTIGLAYFLSLLGIAYVVTLASGMVIDLAAYVAASLAVIAVDDTATLPEVSLYQV